MNPCLSCLSCLSYFSLLCFALTYPTSSGEGDFILPFDFQEIPTTTTTIITTIITIVVVVIIVAAYVQVQVTQA